MKNKTIKIIISVVLAALIIAGVIIGVIGCQNNDHNHSHESSTPETTGVVTEDETTGIETTVDTESDTETDTDVETAVDESSSSDTADAVTSDEEETTVDPVTTEETTTEETTVEETTVEETTMEEVTTVHEHSYVSKITKAATCTEEGEKTFTCECGESYKEKIAKADHKYTRKLTKDPTCTEKGLYTYTCSVCGKSYTENIPAQDHNWDEWVIIKQVSETEDGIQERTCERCGKKETKIIEKKEDLCPRDSNGLHWYQLYSVDTIPTETTEGKSTWKCGNCGKIITKTTPPQKKEDIQKYIKEWKDRYENNPEILNITGSEYSDGLNMRGYVIPKPYYCDKCDKAYPPLREPCFEPVKIDAQLRTVTKEATDTEKGTASLICSHCGHIIDTVTLQAKNSPYQYFYTHDEYVPHHWQVSVYKIYSECPDYDLKRDIVYFKFAKENPDLVLFSYFGFGDTRTNAESPIDITFLSDTLIRYEFINSYGVLISEEFDMNSLPKNYDFSVELTDWGIVVSKVTMGG